MMDSNEHNQVAQLEEQNQRLVETLREARSQLVAMKEEIDKLSAPPSGYGVFLGFQPDGSADVFASGKKFKVTLAPSIDPEDLKRGHEVILNDALNIIQVMDYARVGEVVTLTEMLPADEGSEPDRALVTTQSDNYQVVLLADKLLGTTLKPGDSLLVETRAGYAFERVPKTEVEQLMLEEVPDIEYSDIGGLESQIEAIRDAVELPFLHADLFKEHKLSAPKGVLLYGPPGTGKTLIAKAVANSLAKKVAATKGEHHVKSYFINISGPELLNKWVGETERSIRMIFQQAREKASEGTPVIVFFDELDALFRTRGTGVSSDMESTVVPQLLSEIDGLEGMTNVIVIGATNRAETVDPAVLRPGRLDVKIKVERPDVEAAYDIFSKYVTDDLPLHEDDLASHGNDRARTVDAMIRAVTDRMYAETEENQFLEVTYDGGSKEILYFRDFSSGAMIAGIVSRAKKSAIKDLLSTGARGIRVSHLQQAVADEFTENEDLPNTTAPDDWSRISGHKGERIVYIRSLIAGKKEDAGKAIKVPDTLGQYL